MPEPSHIINPLSLCPPGENNLDGVLLDLVGGLSKLHLTLQLNPLHVSALCHVSLHPLTHAPQHSAHFRLKEECCAQLGSQNGRSVHGMRCSRREGKVRAVGDAR